jgi:hypothetical protein
MIKADYIEIEENETKDDVALYNIKLSDEYKNSETMIYSFMAWFKNNDTRDFQDLEKMMRDNNLDTHLVAKKFDLENVPEGAKISVPNNHVKNDEKNYFDHIVMISCRPREEALGEVIQFGKSYEENFEKLARTGSIFKTNELLNNAKDERIKDIINSTKKYKFIKYNNLEALGYMIEDITKQFGKAPTKIKVGTKDGKDLFGLMVDGVVRNPIVFSYTGDDNEVDLIDLRKFGRMKNDEEEGEKQVEELND